MQFTGDLLAENPIGGIFAKINILIKIKIIKKK